jgi:hypothetical protein
MVAAIGSTTLPSSSSTGAWSPVAGLEAQIQRYQKQLSDCVNCDSAKTIEGKKNIQDISDKISTAKAKIEQINQAQSLNQPSRIDNQINSPLKQEAVTAAPSIDSASASTNTTQPSAITTVGSLINVSA